MTHRVRRRLRRGGHTGAVLCLLTLVGGVVPLAIAGHFGALGIPRNDDWAYAAGAYAFADSGTVTGSRWAGMNLVGQLVLAYPVVAVFGHHIRALQFEVAVIGVVGLFATYDLARQLVTLRRAIFVAVLVAVLPVWASLSASFMTDVPAFTLTMLGLALGMRAVTGPTVRVGMFVASLAAGFGAFTIREVSLVAPLAVGAVAALVARPASRPRRSTIVGSVVGLTTAAAAFFWWRRSLPGFLHTTPHAPTGELVDKAALVSLRASLLVGLFVAPAIALAGPQRVWRNARVRAPRVALVAAGAVGALTGATLVRQWSKPEVLGPGDYVLPNGSLGTSPLKGVRPDLFPRFVLVALAIVAALALVTLVTAVAATVPTFVAGIRRRELTVGENAGALVLTLTVTGYAAESVLGVGFGYTRFFDRYLLPVVPLVAILVLRGVPQLALTRRDRIAGGAALVALAVVGLVFAANAAAFDGTKWNVARRAVTVAGDPTRVDGGHIWNDAVAGRRIRGPLDEACVVLRAGPRPPADDPDVVGAERVWGPTGTQTWVVAWQVRPC